MEEEKKHEDKNQGREKAGVGRGEPISGGIEKKTTVDQRVKRYCGNGGKGMSRFKVWGRGLGK
jgi:hypothetical protein